MWGWLIALISGALMSIQGVFNTGLTKQTSLWVANSWVQGTALVVCLGAWAIKERRSFGTLFQVDSKYMLLGGVIGAFIGCCVIQAVIGFGLVFLLSGL